jgi:ribonucleoside-diphosphate reductase beta chain
MLVISGFGEYPDIMTDELKKSIYQAARDTIDLEDNFIDKTFTLGPIEGLDPRDLKQFIRHRGNTKLQDLGLKKNWKNIDKDALERFSWFDVLSSGVSHADFFASRVSDYSKGNSDFTGVWDDIT